MTGAVNNTKKGNDNMSKETAARRLVAAHARYQLGREATETWLGDRLQLRDERGDITPRMVGAALMAGAAIAVIAILRGRLETRANTVPLQ